MTTMLRATRSILLSAATLFAIASLAACAREENTAQPGPEVNSKAAEMRTEVPLTRPIALDKAGEVVDLTFDVPPPGPNASSTLSLGLRVSGADSAQSAAMADKLVEAGLAADVTLMRVDGMAAIPLIRRDFNGHGPTLLVPVRADGRVPGVVRDTVDVIALREAGLVRQGGHDRTLAFAWAENIQPGRYQLRLELVDPPQELAALKTELLVAYQHKAK